MTSGFKPYTQEELAEKYGNPLCAYVWGQDPRIEEKEQRWLATVAAMRAERDALVALLARLNAASARADGHPK